MFKKIAFWGLSLLILSIGVAALLGCGGSSSGTDSTVGLFFSDNARVGIDQVVVTVYKVSLRSATRTVTLFQETDGMPIDVRALHDGVSSKFAKLGDIPNIPRDAYTNVDIDLDKSIKILRGAAAAHETVQLPDTLDLSPGRCRISFNISLALNGSTDDVVVDFDLANSTIVGGRFTPVVKEGNKTEAKNETKQEPFTIRGVISGLTTTSFVITGADNRRATVMIDENTVIHNNDGSDNPALANGQTLEATCTAKNDRTLRARVIKIRKVVEAVRKAEAEGVPSNIVVGTRSMALTLQRFEGFVPTRRVITVQGTGNTIVFSSSGVPLEGDLIPARLSAATSVQVRGTYNATTNVLTAEYVRIKESETRPREVKAVGPGSSYNESAGTFTIAPRELEGLPTTVTSVNVATSGTTIYKNAAGTVITKTQFFAGAPSAAEIRAFGAFNTTTRALSAAVVQLRAAS